MTRSPLTSTLLALVPLVALAFPLSQALNPPSVEQFQVKEKVVTQLRADVLIRSAHPFQKATINGVIFSESDEEHEIQINPEDPIIVEVTWPEGTPETALLVEVFADGQDLKAHTLWGSGSALEEITFQWEPPKFE